MLLHCFCPTMPSPILFWAVALTLFAWLILESKIIPFMKLPIQIEDFIEKKTLKEFEM